MSATQENNKRKKRKGGSIPTEESSNFALRRTNAVNKQVNASLGHLNNFLGHLNDIDEENHPYREYEESGKNIPSTYFHKNEGEKGLSKFCGEFAEYLCKQKSLGSAESVKHYMKVKHTK